MKNPLLVSRTAKYLASFNFSITSSIVWELHTGLTISLLRSVGSKQIRRVPFGFFTITKEFNHSGLMSLPSNLEIIPCASILSSSFLSFSHIASGTFLGGFCIRIPFCLVVICTGLHLNLPIPAKSLEYLG